MTFASCNAIRISDRKVQKRRLRVFLNSFSKRTMIIWYSLSDLPSSSTMDCTVRCCL